MAAITEQRLENPTQGHYSEEEEEREEGEPITPSSYPEFAHCFLFFQKFGNYLSLSEVTLNELERFFQHGTIHTHAHKIVHYIYF